MMTPKRAILLHRVLLDPGAVRGFSEVDWDLLVRQARHANLLGRLYHLLARALPPSAIPERAGNHLRSAAVMADRQHLSVRHEAQLLRDTLAPLGQPLVLLKGAAYVAAGLPAALGRVFADLDILVPKERLGEIESALMLRGWVGGSADAYDQRYYRQWMHELPPMQHMMRGTVLDVHHTILPPTARLRPDAEALLAASVEVPGLPGVRTLSPYDMVLHSATHMFHEGEPDNLLRDLSDLDLLLRHFAAADPGFWADLQDRAAQMRLNGPLCLALRYARETLATPVPPPVIAAVGVEIGRPLLDFIYRRLLRPLHESTAGWATPTCRRVLYVRAHWLRMPPHLLAYHLAHKAIFPPKERLISR